MQPTRSYAGITTAEGCRLVLSSDRAALESTQSYPLWIKRKEGLMAMVDLTVEVEVPAMDYVESNINLLLLHPYAVPPTKHAKG